MALRVRMTCHHGIPQVRCESVGIDPDWDENHLPKPEDLHFAWHRLFGALTPYEVVWWLERMFDLMFGENLEQPISDYRLVFGDVHWTVARQIVIDHWTPKLTPEVAAELSNIHVARKSDYGPGWRRKYFRQRREMRERERRRQKRLAKQIQHYDPRVMAEIRGQRRILKAA
jgi:hypothetical protein